MQSTHNKRLLKAWGVVCFNPTTGYQFVVFDRWTGNTWALYRTRKEARIACKQWKESMGHKNFKVVCFQQMQERTKC